LLRPPRASSREQPPVNQLRRAWSAVVVGADNSPRMIFEHYRELATGAEGEKWFASCRRRPEPRKS
jgi:hypothetical protein